ILGERSRKCSGKYRIPSAAEYRNSPNRGVKPSLRGYSSFEAQAAVAVERGGDLLPARPSDVPRMVAVSRDSVEALSIEHVFDLSQRVGQRGAPVEDLRQVFEGFGHSRCLLSVDELSDGDEVDEV